MRSGRPCRHKTSSGSMATGELHGNRYVWVPGAWQRPPYPGAYWTHPHYDHYREGLEGARRPLGSRRPRRSPRPRRSSWSRPRSLANPNFDSEIPSTRQARQDAGPLLFAHNFRSIRIRRGRIQLTGKVALAESNPRIRIIRNLHPDPMHARRRLSIRFRVRLKAQASSSCERDSRVDAALDQSPSA